MCPSQRFPLTPRAQGSTQEGTHFRRNGDHLVLTAAESAHMAQIARKLRASGSEQPHLSPARAPSSPSRQGLPPASLGRGPLPAPSRVLQPPTEEGLKPPAVLVVDDRPQALQLVEALLKGLVQAVRKATSGEEALEILAKEDFAVVLLDVRMRGLDGFEVARRMREVERTRLTPIIFLTGVQMADSDVLQGYAAGAVDYLLKPLDPFILRSKVAVFVELYQKSREIERQARELERQQNFIDRLLRQVPVGMAFFDRSSVCRMVNSEFLRLTGLARGMVAGGSVERALEGLGVDASLWQTVLRTGEVVRATGLPSPARPDKAARAPCVDLEALPVAGEGGFPEGVLIILHDVTDRAEIERLQAAHIDSLEHIDALKDQFLGMLSHELRTPLNFIVGFASVLEDEVAGRLNEDQAKYVKRILTGSNVLCSLVDDLLDLSRIQAGKFALNCERVDFCAAARDVLTNLLPLAEQKSISLIDKLPCDLPALTSDRNRIGQILVNLVNNAIKFTDEGGSVSIRARVEDESLLCEVQDTGIGIAPEDQERLFHPFTQVDMSSTRKAGGTGLGLSICRALVEAHGGTIGVNSTPGEGSVFWFRIPMVNPRCGCSLGEAEKGMSE